VLYVQVLATIAFGVLLGYFVAAMAVEMQPLGDGFIKLIKMAIVLVVFFTVVSGVSGMRDLGKGGRVGVKSLLYFELVSTVASHSVLSLQTFFIRMPASIPTPHT
jgi:aerobic C4-dicarboxylate transport protein